MAKTTTEGIWISEEDGELTNVDAFEAKELYSELATLDELVGAHGEIVICNTKAGAAVFRVPKGAEYDRFLGGILDDRKEQKVKASSILARTCVVFPDKTIFAQWVDRYPGIPSACTKPLNKLMGGTLVARGKE